MLLLLIVLAALGGHAVARGMVLPDRVRAARRIALAMALAGLALTGRALVGVLSTKVAADETPGVTPLCLRGARRTVRGVRGGRDGPERPPRPKRCTPISENRSPTATATRTCDFFQPRAGAFSSSR
ncbi:hypothetical protein ACQEU6_12400 [Spirillospora sp. CA-108201]